METAYDTLAALARYLFILLMFFIIGASAVLSVKEARLMRRARRLARMNIRYIRFIDPEELNGRRFYINGEISIGSGAGDDIRLEGCGLLPKHARLYDNKGCICITVKRKRFFSINAQPCQSRTVMLAPDDRVRIMDAEFICAAAHGEDNADAQA